jgi:hypothetical protein
MTDSELVHSIESLLDPSTNVVVKVDLLVKAQLQLQVELDDLNHKLAVATAHTSEGLLYTQRVERYINRVRLCRSRIETLNGGLTTVKNRLSRVLAHISAQNKAVAKGNEVLQAEMEQVVGQPPVEMSES